MADACLHRELADNGQVLSEQKHDELNWILERVSRPSVKENTVT